MSLLLRWFVWLVFCLFCCVVVWFLLLSFPVVMLLAAVGVPSWKGPSTPFWTNCWLLAAQPVQVILPPYEKAVRVACSTFTSGCAWVPAPSASQAVSGPHLRARSRMGSR